MTKARTIMDDKYKKKYIRNNREHVSKIMKMRLHMASLECNFKSSIGLQQCPLCVNRSEVVNTKHNFNRKATLQCCEHFGDKLEVLRKRVTKKREELY